MSVSSVSFWQQDQNYWNQSASNSASVAQTDAVISNMFGASTTLSAGLASIANQTALDRVNTQLTSAVQSALASINGGSSSTSSSSTGSSSSSSSSSTSSSSSSGSSSSSTTSGSSSASTPTPAIGTGTAPLTAGTSLLTLGIVPTGTITVSDGTNTTTYKSTGHDTVGDLLNAINTNAYGNAQVTAWLDPTGELVLTAKNQTASISVGGAYAPNVGFGAGNNFFTATTPTTSSSNSASSSSGTASTSSTSGSGSSTSSSTNSTNSTTSSSSASTSSTSKSSSGASLLNSALALQSTGTAEILLSSAGLSGSLVNLLA